MAGDSGNASKGALYQLQQPEKLRNVLDQDKPEDCLACRLTGEPVFCKVFTSLILTKHIGAGAFMGLGAYSYFSGTQQLRLQQAAILKSKSMFGMKSRQAGITGIAAAFVGMGLYRLVN